MFVQHTLAKYEQNHLFSPFVTIDVPFAKTKPILLLVPFSHQTILVQGVSVVSLAQPESILPSTFAQPKSILASPFSQAKAKLLLIAFPEPKAVLVIPFAKTKGVTPLSWPERTKHLLGDLSLLRISSEHLKKRTKLSFCVRVIP